MPESNRNQMVGINQWWDQPLILLLGDTLHYKWNGLGHLRRLPSWKIILFFNTCLASGNLISINPKVNNTYSKSVLSQFVFRTLSTPSVHMLFLNWTLPNELVITYLPEWEGQVRKAPQDYVWETTCLKSNTKLRMPLKWRGQCHRIE